MFVETKRWKDRVGVEVIDRVYGAFLGEKTTFGWHIAMVVTVSGFTEMDKYTPEQLRMMRISLKDGDDIRRWLKDYRFNQSGLWLRVQKVLTPYNHVIHGSGPACENGKIDHGRPLITIVRTARASAHIDFAPSRQLTATICGQHGIMHR